MLDRWVSKIRVTLKSGNILKTLSKCILLSNQPGLPETLCAFRPGQIIVWKDENKRKRLKNEILLF